MLFFCLFLNSKSEHDTLLKRICLDFAKESTFLYPGNWKFKFQDVIRFLFVQTKNTPTTSSNVNPLEITMATKYACVIKDPKPVSLEGQIFE